MLTLFGGSFDPPHLGHINGVLNIALELGISHVDLLPCAQSPLKQQAGASQQQRIAMLKLVCQHVNHKHPVQLSINDTELHLPAPSYTVDTLQHLRAKLGNNIAILFILGEDSVYSIDKWKRWQQLTHYCHLIVMPRQHHHQAPSSELRQWLDNKRADTWCEVKQSACGKVFFAKTPLTTISSSEIRDMITHNQTEVANWLLPEVATFIVKHSIYNPNKEQHCNQAI